MQVAILGASGFVGSFLAAYFQQKGLEIVPLGRKDLTNLDELALKLDKVDTLINLAGAPISKRWTEEYKKVLYSSRIESTKILAQAILKTQNRPCNYFSASAVGIYAPLEDRVQDEENFVYGENFLSKICQDWEKEALQFTNFNLRVVIFRFGVVLGKGGALAKLLPFFRWGIGGKIASGNQGFPWVHLEDLARAFYWALNKKDARGIYNLCAPQLTTNKDFTRTLARVLKRPAFFPVPRFILKLALGEGEMVLTQGAKVVPSRLQKEGFSFKYNKLEEALKNIWEHWS
ncbi:MAG: uncharacterized protein PWR24_197 [Desulfonauticus sp.]|jgi:hypothetical protein|nr:MAG: hypothetical protein XD41_1885 [Desulfonauticus sp. 38_4375]MDK2920640.1 uncharacterized protein [Desulfonauticus sp.]